MKAEARWTNAGRDRITIEDLIDMGNAGYEFVISGGHIESVLFEMPEGDAA